MDEFPAGRGADRPAEMYSSQLERLQRLRATERRRERMLGYAKLVLAFFAVVLVIVGIRYSIALYVLPAPVIAFVVLAVRHERVLQSLRRRERAIEFYERGLASIEDRWAGKGETGERFLDPAHPYAR